MAYHWKIFGEYFARMLHQTVHYYPEHVANTNFTAYYTMTNDVFQFDTDVLAEHLTLVETQLQGALR